MCRCFLKFSELLRNTVDAFVQLIICSRGIHAQLLDVCINCCAQVDNLYIGSINLLLEFHLVIRDITAQRLNLLVVVVDGFLDTSIHAFYLAVDVVLQRSILSSILIGNRSIHLAESVLELTGKSRYVISNACVDCLNFYTESSHHVCLKSSVSSLVFIRQYADVLDDIVCNASIKCIDCFIQVSSSLNTKCFHVCCMLTTQTVYAGVYIASQLCFQFFIGNRSIMANSISEFSVILDERRLSLVNLSIHLLAETLNACISICPIDRRIGNQFSDDALTQNTDIINQCAHVVHYRRIENADQRADLRTDFSY